MREAIALATRARQGREATLLHNNLGELLLVFEGPAASLDVLRAGIALAEAWGIATDSDFTRASTLQPLFESGELDEALENAVALAGRLERVDVLARVAVQAGQARIRALRGEVAQVAGSLDWLETASRGAGGT